jgi:hypothetical protein
MKSRKHYQLKKNPLVRFIRGVFRLLRVVFKPKNRNLRSLQHKQSESDLPQVRSDRQQQAPDLEPQNLELEQQPIALDLHHQGQFITVGELFEQIKWQISPETVIQTNISEQRAHQPYDVSRN